MSLVYQVAFPQDAPELEPLLRRVAAEWGPTVTVLPSDGHWLAVRQNEETLLILTVGSESNSYEFFFGEYHYQTNWYIELDKMNMEKARRFYLELLKELITSFSYDFLSFFNGELVVVRKEGSHVFLNTEKGLWDDPDRLAILRGIDYKMVAYPI